MEPPLSSQLAATLFSPLCGFSSNFSSWLPIRGRIPLCNLARLSNGLAAWQKASFRTTIDFGLYPDQYAAKGELPPLSVRPGISLQVKYILCVAVPLGRETLRSRSRSRKLNCRRGSTGGLPPLPLPVRRCAYSTPGPPPHSILEGRALFLFQLLWAKRCSYPIPSLLSAGSRWRPVQAV